MSVNLSIKITFYVFVLYFLSFYNVTTSEFQSNIFLSFFTIIRMTTNEKGCITFQIRHFG